MARSSSSHGASWEIDPTDLEKLLRAVKWIIGRAATSEHFAITPEGLSVYRYEGTQMYPTLVFYFTVDSDERCTLRDVRRP